MSCSVFLTKVQINAAAKRHHKYCVKPQKGELMNEWKKNKTMVLHSGRGPDSFLHRQLAVGSRGLCQGGGWRRDRASGEPQTTTDGATHSSLSSTPNQPSARAAGCFEGHTLTGASEDGRPSPFVPKQYPSPRPQRVRVTTTSAPEVAANVVPPLNKKRQEGKHR